MINVMELAWIQSLVQAIPEADENTPQQFDRLISISNQFFKWEREHILLGQPTDQEQKDHREMLGSLTKVVKLLLRLNATQRLELLKHRLDDSWGMFYSSMSDSQAEAILTAVFPE